MAPENSSTESEERILRIATRESPLALWQARHVADFLSRLTARPKIVPMTSSGDVDMRPIDGKRSVGVFTKRIQQALNDGEGDVAVHSMKDLPTEVQPELVLVATPERETVSDSLVSTNAFRLDTLPEGALVGTGSRRRAAQLRRHRPDLQVAPIRGNVQTRLKKMQDGQFDAIILATAGIDRLGMSDLPRVELSLDEMLPAPGQGALAIEVRTEDSWAIEIVSQLNDAQANACTLAERTLLACLHGGCLAPIAALATIQGESLQLKARVLSLDGQTCLECASSTPIRLDSDDWQAAATKLGEQVSDQLIDQGARELIAAGR